MPKEKGDIWEQESPSDEIGEWIIERNDQRLTLRVNLTRLRTACSLRDIHLPSWIEARFGRFARETVEKVFADLYSGTVAAQVNPCTDCGERVPSNTEDFNMPEHIRKINELTAALGRIALRIAEQKYTEDQSEERNQYLSDVMNDFYEILAEKVENLDTLIDFLELGEDEFYEEFRQAFEAD